MLLCTPGLRPSHGCFARRPAQSLRCVPGQVAVTAALFLALGMVALGSLANFDPAWDGPVASALARAAAQLSSDLGYAGL